MFFADLSGLFEPGLVPGTVTRALGLQQVPGQGPLEALTARLSKRKLLLLLDNCEHLVGACTKLASTLPGNCPGIQILATSRECLGALGESVVDVGGLELPERAGEGDERWAARSEAGRLFVDRARMATAGFVVDDLNAPRHYLRALGRYPLALELAAARARLISVRAIAEALSDRSVS